MLNPSKPTANHCATYIVLYGCWYRLPSLLSLVCLHHKDSTASPNATYC